MQTVYLLEQVAPPSAPGRNLHSQPTGSRSAASNEPDVSLDLKSFMPRPTV